MFVRASAPAVAIEMAELVDVEDVEVVQTGLKYPLASGPRTFTQDDLSDIVSSQDDAAVKTPRLKLGHVANMGLMEDGQPAIGTLEGLKLTQGGHQITGTLKNIPAWLARILPAAYPARSIEALTGVTTSTGNNWSVVLTDLALLGVVWPGVNTLEDIQALYSKDGPDNLQILSTRGEVEAVFGEKLAASGVMAQVDVDKISRAYRENKDPDQMWWWIRSMMIEPNELIVEDEEKGQLYRIPYEVKGEDVNFSDPVPVRLKYEDKPEPKQKEAASMALCAAMESMGATSVVSYHNKKEFDMAGVQSELDPVALRNALGLEDGATDEDVSKALASAGFVAKPGAEVTDEQRAAASEQAGTSAEQGPHEQNNQAPSGGESNDPARVESTRQTTQQVAASGDVVQLDRATYDQLLTGAKAGVQAFERQKRGDRDEIITAAIREGRIAPARREHWEAKWKADEEEVRTLLTASADKGGLAAGLIPVSATGGTVPQEQATQDDAYPAEWLPEVQREVTQ